MKKSTYLLICLYLIFAGNALWSQCVPSCSNYIVSPISYSQFPTAGTSPVSLFSPNADDGYASVNLGFSFTYYCTTYTNVLICSNGFLVFSSSGAPYINGADAAQGFPNSAVPNGVIALNMNDFDVTAGGAITYTTIGTAPNRMFIVTYSNVPIWYDAVNNIPSTPVYNTGQIVLYETSNNIEVHTANIGQSPYAMTQGIENTTGSLGLTVPGRSASFWSSVATAYRFSNTLMGTPPTGLAGNTPTMCNATAGTFTINSMPGATAYNWILPNGWSGSSATTAITATAGLSGNVSVTATYSCGISAPALFQVNVLAAPLINITSIAPQVLCSGNSVFIDASGAATYSLLPLANVVTPPFTFTPVANISYSLTGTGANGCDATQPPPLLLTVNQTPTITVSGGSICIGDSYNINATGANSYQYNSSPFSIVTPTSTGVTTYVVIGTALNSCTASAISGVTVNPLPVVTATANRSQICVKESTTLTAQGATSYTWTYDNSTNTTLSLSPLVTNVYTVKGTDANGCSNTATVSVIVNLCSGLASNSAEIKMVKVFPNPFSDICQIEMALDAEVTLSDITGKQVFKTHYAAGNHTVDLSTVPSGIYLLRLTSGNTTENLRLMKQ